MEDYSEATERMVQEQLLRRGIHDKKVLNAFRVVPRHLFVEPSLADKAYEDHPLPIGERQTISQPYMVALMLEALELQGEEKVLEIGAGSGYMTALLCLLVKKVYSIDRIQALADSAKCRLIDLGYTNFIIQVGDGTLGWEEESPFDAIVVSASSPEIPLPLLRQLDDGGTIVIPIGDVDSQILKKVVRKGESFQEYNLGGCIFVRLIGAYGWKD